MFQPLIPVSLAGAPPAPPVVFLHGFLGDASDWRAVAEALAPEHHVLAVDLPGHGPDATPTTMGLDACAEALLAGFARAGLRRPDVAGYSMGGRISLYLARRYPDRVGRLVLESASPGIADAAQRASRAVQDAALAERLAAMEPGGAAFRAFLEEWYAMSLFSTLQRRPELLEPLIARRLTRCVPAAVGSSLTGLGTGAQASLWEELHALKAPALAITGEDDRKFRIIAEDMALACPAMATEILTGCGHNVHLENHEAFVTVVRAFLHPNGGP
ncbi:MAG: 2-succinyl-6-hydroxy-2,4-cyclohexadiene-1-carboxylate synthase [Candidatus Hydrogenedentes bacterium]|nr:2-succinyl-6-hydroxy-2,4-cyclohexadiene-1-carboxylate synthase [Candidatus Hydrogenedentota bacterium]